MYIEWTLQTRQIIRSVEISDVEITSVDCINTNVISCLVHLLLTKRAILLLYVQ